MPQKPHLNGSKERPPKRHFLTPKMSFSRFSNFDLCRGTLGSQGLYPRSRKCKENISSKTKGQLLEGRTMSSKTQLSGPRLLIMHAWHRATIAAKRFITVCVFLRNPDIFLHNLLICKFLMENESCALSLH